MCTSTNRAELHECCKHNKSKLLVCSEFCNLPQLLIYATFIIKTVCINSTSGPGPKVQVYFCPGRFLARNRAPFSPWNHDVHLRYRFTEEKRRCQDSGFWTLVVRDVLMTCVNFYFIFFIYKDSVSLVKASHHKH